MIYKRQLNHHDVQKKRTAAYMKIGLTMNQLSHSACVWLLRYKECNCLSLYEWWISNRKLAFLPEILKYYRSIEVSFLNYGYYIISSTQIFWYSRSFSFSTLSWGISSSFLWLKLPSSEVSPNALLRTQYSTCVSNLCQVNMSNLYVTVFYLKWDFYISIQPVIQARKRESSFPLCFCTSHRLSSFLTPKSFINMLLPFLFLLRLLLLKFLPSFAWTATEELDRLASNYLLSQLFLYCS